MSTNYIFVVVPGIPYGVPGSCAYSWCYLTQCLIYSSCICTFLAYKFDKILFNRKKLSLEINSSMESPLITIISSALIILYSSWIYLYWYIYHYVSQVIGLHSFPFSLYSWQFLEGNNLSFILISWGWT
jgi:hypothetical protein